MNRVAKRTWVAMILCLVLLSGLVFFICEFVAESKNWTVSAGSPHVYEGDTIGCGAITDRDGNVLLDANNGRVYAESEALRKATVHWVGDDKAMVNAPIIDHYSSYLVDYDLFNGVYHYGDTAGVARLTVSSQVQIAALEALGDKKGTVAVYNYKTGELLCCVTTPNFDPMNPPVLEGDDSTYEGVYYNRFTQATYTPGSIFKIVTLAAALEEMPEIQQMSFTCTGSESYGPDKITCERTHGTQSLQAAFRNSCNCAFSQIVELLGPVKLREYVEKFGLMDAVSFDGITTAKGNFQVADSMDANVAWSGIGQHLDQVNPCAFMTFTGTIAAGGQTVYPHLVGAVTVGNQVTYEAQTQTGKQILSPETAQILQTYLRHNVSDLYGDWNFPGLNVCAKTGTGEVGGDKKPNAMLSGFVSDDSYPLAFIVCVEEGGYGSAACIPIASKVLSSCKSVLDNIDVQ